MTGPRALTIPMTVVPLGRSGWKCVEWRTDRRPSPRPSPKMEEGMEVRRSNKPACAAVGRHLTRQAITSPSLVAMTASVSLSLSVLTGISFTSAWALNLPAVSSLWMLLWQQSTTMQSSCPSAAFETAWKVASGRWQVEGGGSWPLVTCHSPLQPDTSASISSSVSVIFRDASTSR